MKITWITRSFLDYRLPVYKALHDLADGRLTLIYYADVVPERVRQKAAQILGKNSKGLTGEFRLSGPKSLGGSMANTVLRIPFQPGLIKAIRESNPDVMVTDGFFQWTYAALLLKLAKRIPHVMCYERTAHTERHAQWYRIAYRRLALNCINAICCNGRLCGEYTQSLGFPEARLNYGHMAADVDGMKESAAQVSEVQATKLKSRYGLKGFVYLYVGRLIPLKGVDKLLQAWKMFNKSGDSSGKSLLLVGDGPQRNQLEAYCSMHSLYNVCFAGNVDYDEIAPFYKAADVFVIPTLEDNWSLVVPEAMACGLPILCSKYNGCWPDLVTADNGWVFDPLDIEETMQCLSQCFRAGERLGAMGEVSRQIVGKNHTPAKAAKAIYDACLIARKDKKKL